MFLTLFLTGNIHTDALKIILFYVDKQTGVSKLNENNS